VSIQSYYPMISSFGSNKSSFFEIVKSANEAFVVGGVRSKWEILFASDSLDVRSDGYSFDLSAYTGAGVMVVLNEGFEWDGWLLCSMKFCDGGHGGCC